MIRKHSHCLPRKQRFSKRGLQELNIPTENAIYIQEVQSNHGVFFHCTIHPMGQKSFFKIYYVCAVFAKRTNNALDFTFTWEFLKHQEQQVKAVLKGTSEQSPLLVLKVHAGSWQSWRKDRTWSRLLARRTAAGPGCACGHCSNHGFIPVTLVGFTEVLESVWKSDPIYITSRYSENTWSSLQPCFIFFF